MYIVALDLGGTNMRAALVDENAAFIEVVKENTIRNNHAAFIAHAIAIIEKLNIEKYPPKGISIGVPGPVRSNGFINELPNIGIKAVDLITPLQERFGLQVVVRNDAEMAAFAEAGLGAGKTAKSVYFVTISTGIGGCLVANKAIKNPSREIGHSLVSYHHGFYEIEKIASGKGILKLLELNNLKLEKTVDFFTAVKEKDLKVLPVFNDWITIIANFFNEINEDYKPDVIAVTGGVLKSKDVFWDELMRHVKHHNIQIAHFSEDAGLIGAALYGFKYIN